MKAQQARHTFLERAEADLAAWRADLRELTSGLARARSDVRADVADGAARLRGQLAIVRHKLSEIGDVAVESWDIAKDSVHGAWVDVRRDVRRTLSRLHGRAGGVRAHR